MAVYTVDPLVRRSSALTSSGSRLNLLFPCPPSSLLASRAFLASLLQCRSPPLNYFPPNPRSCKYFFSSVAMPILHYFFAASSPYFDLYRLWHQVTEHRTVWVLSFAMFVTSSSLLLSPTLLTPFHFIISLAACFPSAPSTTSAFPSRPPCPPPPARRSTRAGRSSFGSSRSQSGGRFSSSRHQSFSWLDSRSWCTSRSSSMCVLAFPPPFLSLLAR